MQKILIVMIIAAVLLAGCAPNQPALVDTGAQVNTAVAQTLAAQQQQIQDLVAQTVAAQNAISTPTPVPPTPTVTVEIPPTPTALTLPTLPANPNNGGGQSYTQPPYACNIITQPYDLTEIHRGNKFDIRWVIVNTGTETWRAGTDVTYMSGPKMTSITMVEIPMALKPNHSYQIDLDAVAPAEKGKQVMAWVIEGTVCYPYVAIIVK